MCVSTCSIGLPYFDQVLADRPAVTVEQPASHDDALAQRFASMLPGQVGVELGHFAAPEHRSREFGHTYEAINPKVLRGARDRVDR